MVELYRWLSSVWHELMCSFSCEPHKALLLDNVWVSTIKNVNCMSKSYLHWITCWCKKKASHASNLHCMISFCLVCIWPRTFFCKENKKWTELDCMIETANWTESELSSSVPASLPCFRKQMNTKYVKIKISIRSPIRVFSVNVKQILQ